MKTWTQMSNEERALSMYEAGGAKAVLAAVDDGLIATDGWSWCAACEADAPVFKERCLVCSTHVAADAEPAPLFGLCEYCGTDAPPAKERKMPGAYYCLRCKGVR